ncbi:S24 family peptidase [Acidovorax sp. NB1]|uniref:S24 family peptidase n=1 Tax=Acidovorax sp. NB1 TaxID=1943571 RepID=UPI0010EA6B6C|nr:S24 family peptidase [Acidovorax sp. NB1]GDY37254.1 repressor [Acidovorax sp. NB1]
MAENKRSKITDEHRAEAARLKALWDDGRPHKTQAEFGEHYGLGNQANVGHYLNGRSALNAKAAAAFAAELQCKVSDFSPRVAGELAMLGGSAPAVPAPAPHEAPSETQGAPADLVITEFDTGGGMDTTGRLLLDDQPGIIKSWRVSHDWLRLNVPSHTGIRNLCIVTGFGPSMRPMFNPGDPLLVDTGVKTVTHEGVYFFRVGDEGYIKMIQRVPDPHGDGVMLNIISKNPDYPPYPMSPKNPHFEVLGKVLTVWRSEQY